MNDMNFGSKWVLVTGASSGLGMEMACQLAREHKANLILVARRMENLKLLKAELEQREGIRCHVIAADLSGLKLRVIQSPLFLDTFNALGTNATPMPFTELYTAMEQAAVDGQENPPATILASKFYEVQKHLVLSRHMYSAWVLLMSKKAWDGLSPEEQKIVQEAAREATLFERKTIRAFSETALGELKKAGMQITELPAAEQARLRAKLQPVLTKYGSEFGEATTSELMGELAKARGTAAK